MLYTLPINDFGTIANIHGIYDRATKPFLNMAGENANYL